MSRFPYSPRRLIALGAVLALSAAATAHAEQSSPTEQGSADTDDTSQAAAVLFVQARAWMREARYDDACAAFEKSQRLDPASGTLLNLGVCREAQGRTKSAYLAYLAGLALSQVERNADGERIARARIAKLEPALTRVVLSVRRPRPGLVVRLDGVAIEPNSWGAALPIDPGSHQLESAAPDQDPWSSTFNIAGPVVRTLEVESPHMKAPRPQLAAAPRAAVWSSPPVAAEAPRASSWPLPVSIGVAGVGAVGTVYFGLLAKHEWDTRNDHCAAGHCDAAAVRASDRAALYARAADVAAGVAAVGSIAVASLLIFQSRQRPRDTPGPQRSSLRLESHGADLSITGSF